MPMTVKRRRDQAGEGHRRENQPEISSAVALAAYGQALESSE